MPRGVLKGTIRGPYKKRPVEDRLWSRVDKKGPKQPHMRSRCWVWTGPLDWSGAGHIFMRGQRPINPTAYRIAWILEHGDPGEKLVLHECDNRACVRPSHLFLGSHKDNTQDMLQKQRHWTTSGADHYKSKGDPVRIYVAFRTDGETVEKTAIGSFTKLKEHMKSAGEGAEFTVVLYDFKPSLGNVCQAIMDVTELPAESSSEHRVNAQGQLREVKS